MNHQLRRTAKKAAAAVLVIFFPLLRPEELKEAYSEIHDVILKHLMEGLKGRNEIKPSEN